MIVFGAGTHPSSRYATPAAPLTHAQPVYLRRCNQPKTSFSSLGRYEENKQYAAAGIR